MKEHSYLFLIFLVSYLAVFNNGLSQTPYKLVVKNIQIAGPDSTIDFQMYVHDPNSTWE